MRQKRTTRRDVGLMRALTPLLCAPTAEVVSDYRSGSVLTRKGRGRLRGTMRMLCASCTERTTANSRQLNCAHYFGTL
jgi:hypothetical protein